MLCEAVDLKEDYQGGPNLITSPLKSRKFSLAGRSSKGSQSFNA